MNIVRKYATSSDCYASGKALGRRNKQQGLMLHSVGCNQPSADVFAKIWDKGNHDVCPHAVIDALSDKVIQVLPWEYRGWHGGGSSNDTHIGVEMCEPACIKYTSGANFTCSDKTTARKQAAQTYNTAVELFAKLCIDLKLDPLKKGVIISHSEGYKLGVASGHADPEHLWKQLGLSFTMDKFRLAVKDKMAEMKGVSSKAEATTTTTKPSDELYRVRKSWEDTKSQIGAFKSLENAKKACKVGYSVFNSKATIVYTNKGNLKSTEEVAKEVIQGKWGNGAERKRRLEAAGYSYKTVQAKVNKMLAS